MVNNVRLNVSVLLGAVPCVAWGKSPEDFEANVVSIVRFEEQVKQETSFKQAAKRENRTRKKKPVSFLQTI
jgi:hypothetical protein